jgi:hypothetical protein
MKKVNGIHEVSGSIPLGSTNEIDNWRRRRADRLKSAALARAGPCA